MDFNIGQMIDQFYDVESKAEIRPMGIWLTSHEPK